MGRPLRTKSRGDVLSSAARISCCAASGPWLRSAAFGVPVLPLVKVTKAGWAGSQGATSVSAQIGSTCSRAALPASAVGRWQRQSVCAEGPD